MIKLYHFMLGPLNGYFLYHLLARYERKAYSLTVAI